MSLQKKKQHNLMDICDGILIRHNLWRKLWQNMNNCDGMAGEQTPEGVCDGQFQNCDRKVGHNLKICQGLWRTGHNSSQTAAVCDKLWRVCHSPWFFLFFSPNVNVEAACPLHSQPFTSFFEDLHHHLPAKFPNPCTKFSAFTFDFQQPPLWEWPVHCILAGEG